MAQAVSTSASAMLLLQKHILDHAGSTDMFRSAKPFPYIILDGFLDEAFCRKLRAEFPAFDTRHAVNEDGAVGRKSTRENLSDLGPAFAEFDALIRSEEFLSMLSDMTGIPDLLYDPEYIGGGTHENLDGQDLDVHIDFNYHPTRRWHRRINMLLFLNEEWDESWGGNFELHEDPWLPRGQGTIVSATPLWNRAVLFETSEKSWHGFPQIRLPEEKRHLSRKSIALYFYTRTRPPEETAAPHSTVYVEQPLPEKFREGYTLTEGDEQKLRQIINRRDQHIKRLYARELGFSKSITELKEHMRLPLVGFAEPCDVTEGLWHDGWVAQDFLCRMRLLKPVESITLVGTFPNGRTSFPIGLTVRLGDATREVAEVFPIEHAAFTLRIPYRSAENTLITLAIHTPETWNPRKEGVNEDGRNLAFHLQRIVFE